MDSKTTPINLSAARSDPARRSEVAVLTGWMEVVIIAVMMAANVVQTSGLLDPFFNAAVAVSLSVQLATILIYCAVAAVRGHVRIVALSLIFAAAIIASCYHFAAIADAGINLNVATPWLGMLMLVVFYESRLPLGTILTIILVVSAVYVVLYDVLAPIIASGGESRTSLASDGVRDRRAFLAALFATYVLCSGVLMIRKRTIVAIPLILISGYAIIIAQSRMYQAVLIITMLTAVITVFAPRLRQPIVFVLAAAFLALSIGNLWGFADSSWNPYELVMTDASGRSRFIQYDDARRVFGDHHIIGTGLSPSIDALTEFVKPRTPFFPSDLGPAGIYFQFGLVGTLLFLVLSIGCIIAAPGRHVRATPLSFALHYTTLNAALGGFFGITILGGSGTPFAMLTVALWLKGGYFSATGRRLPRSTQEIAPDAFGTRTQSQRPTRAGARLTLR